MKSHKEIFEALLAGKSIVHVHGLSVMLSENGAMVEPKTNTATTISWGFVAPEDWSILVLPREFVVKVNKDGEIISAGELGMNWMGSYETIRVREVI